MTAKREKHDKAMDVKMNKCQATPQTTMKSTVTESKTLLHKKMSETVDKLYAEATQKAVTQFTAETDAKLSSLREKKSLTLEKRLAEMVEEAESGSCDRMELIIKTAVDAYETRLKAMVDNTTATVDSRDKTSPGKYRLHTIPSCARMTWRGLMTIQVNRPTW